jgi:hypothetical protein
MFIFGHYIIHNTKLDIQFIKVFKISNIYFIEGLSCLGLKVHENPLQSSFNILQFILHSYIFYIVYKRYI